MVHQERAGARTQTQLPLTTILLTGLKHHEEIDGADGLRNKLVD